MIKKLRRRMTLLVAAVLMLVTAGIVIAINYMNWHNITREASAALKTLSENSGARPTAHKNEDQKDLRRPEPPEEENVTGNVPSEPVNRSETASVEETDRGPDRGTAGTGPPEKSRPGEPPQMEDALAALSNYYVVTLSKDDSMEKWTSDREDLYSDRQVSDITQVILAEGRKEGRVGTQFYSITQLNGKKLLIILDERLEIMNAGRVLRTTILVASIACFLLCAGAYFLIRVMVKPVQEAFDRQRQFVWDASHELKTPLAVIGANADVLRGEIGENEYLAYIRSEVRRSDELVKSLLTLARMDHGTQKADLKKTDLGKAVLSVALPFESSAYEAGKEFAVDVPEGISCTGDSAMLQQLTVILLGNALKYSDKGGRIRLQVREKGRYRQIIVSNTGEGIPPEDMDRLFNRFYRADTSRNRSIEGFGLGLSIAQGIAEAHHGKIRAECTPDGWTTFTVSIPA